MHTFKLTTVAAAALFFLSAVNAESHAAIARRHMHVHSHKRAGITKRSTCEFPKDAGLVAVTPGEKNAGWAMSPDQPCKPGMYCPYACPPGQLMAQWDPNAKTYSYPQSMNGGLYCNEDGEIEKPFPKKPYCYDGAGTVSCKNKAGGQVSVCQTVLPGNEAMLIPTLVESMSDLAVPDTSYWAKTAAHFYINPPGVNPEEACVWGTKDKPVGNWSPYVAGANEVDSGVTFVTIGWNPIYIEPDVTFRDVMPNWGVKIECEGGKCGGLPCYIDPNEHKVNEVSQKNPPGAGGANFCVVSVPKGAKANIVVFNKDSGSGENKSKSASPSSAKSTPSPTKSASSASKTPEATSTEPAKKSSSASSTKSSGSESSRTTNSPSTKTDSPSSTKTKDVKGPEPTGTSDDDKGSEKDSEKDSEGGSEEGSEEGSEKGSGKEGEYGGDDSEHEGSDDYVSSGDDEDSDDTAIHPDDAAEFIAVDDNQSSSGSSSDAIESSEQASGGGSSTTSGSSSPSTDQPLSSGGSISFSSATSVTIFSILSALAILL